MPLFRKRPVVIEAVQLASYIDMLKWAAWCGGVVRQEDPGPAYMVTPTLEGDHRADVSDWIIKGIKGEFYPCKRDIFEMTYEAVGD